ncbi:glycoside hydrolase family 57 protein [Candidatus Micrarchaeota archaeon]|nr:glycoside hydrolase family 57 protein [Candidatus Micrarchaeota archaeon]
MDIIFYFQIHQPYRLNWVYPFSDMADPDNKYINYELTEKVFNKVSDKCYIPATNIILDLLEEYPDFKVVYSITGVALDQMKMFRPDVYSLFSSFKKFVATNQVEFLGETYYHSLTSLYPTYEEFIKQVVMHSNEIKKTFGMKPKNFRNTELLYTPELSSVVSSFGFSSMITEGADDITDNPHRLYDDGKIKLLLRDYRLSDDIGYRFSAKQWDQYPLTAEKYVSWLSSLSGDFTLIGMDYETFGEHHWKDTGILNFLQHLPKQIIKHDNLSFSTVDDVVNKFKPNKITINRTVSWADIERNESAWLGNDLQRELFNRLYSMNDKVKKTKDKKLIALWRKIQSSDHLYYVSTKNLSDQDVHNYFSPYNSPFEAFINYMNILDDFQQRFIEKNKKHRFNMKN